VESTAPHRTIAFLSTDDAVTHDVVGAVPGVTVEARTVPAPASGFAGVYALADAAGRALSEGADGVVIVLAGDAPDETAWALDLLHPGDAPLVIAAGPDHAVDVADAISVAASAPAGAGCLLVTHGEIHTARHARLTGVNVLASPGAGPLGHVTAGTVRLLWRPPERLTIRGGAVGAGSPRVGLHTTVLGDDGELLGALAERCDGLVVDSTATGGIPDELAGVLAEASARIPVVLAAPTQHESLAVSSLDPRKARVLMHLLLAAGRDREAVLSAFATADRPDPAQL
jgi:L-asparaginase